MKVKSSASTQGRLHAGTESSKEDGGRLRAIDCTGGGARPPREPPELRLKTIFEGVEELIEEHAPDAVALEESFVGADARTALSVGQATRRRARRVPRAPALTAPSTRPRR